MSTQKQNSPDTPTMDHTDMHFLLDRSGSMTSFTERFSDEVTGWAMTIGLQIPLKYDNCNLPMT